MTHFQRLLEAELWAYKGKHYLAKNDYEAGTVLAARGGFIHDAALANERYAEFLLDEMDDKESAVYKLKEAIKLYSEWGAHAKAEQLSRKYDCFLSHPPTVLTLPLSGDLETYSSSHS